MTPAALSTTFLIYRLFNFPDRRDLISFQAAYSLCGNKISNCLLLILVLPSRSFMKIVSSCFLVKHLKLTFMPILLSDPLSPLNVLHLLRCFISLDFQLCPHSSHSSANIAPLFHFPLQVWHLQPKTYSRNAIEQSEIRYGRGQI